MPNAIYPEGQIRQEKSSKITELLIQTPVFTESTSIHIFRSLKDEPDTIPIISHATHTNRIIHYPTESPYDNQETDIIIIPCRKVDRHMNRVGRGGGYYDRFLSCVRGYKIGIAYYSQLYSKLWQLNTWDVQMDMIITEEGIITKRDSDDPNPFGWSGYAIN